MMGVDWARGLLVSVRSAKEAEAALRGGAGIIDVKEPTCGPLGRAGADVTASIVAVVAGRVPVTLACGELADGIELIRRHLADVLRRLAAGMPGPVAVKAGPRDLDAVAWAAAFGQLKQALPAGVEPVAVAYADSTQARSAAPGAILTAAHDTGATTLLIDTFDKRGPGLMEVATREELAGWVAQAGHHGLRLALAGRLTGEAVATVFGLGANVAGVRSAACVGGRDGRIDAEAVSLLAARLPDRTGAPRGL